MTEKNTPYKFDAVDLILYLWNKKLPIILLTGIATVVSVLVSFTIDNKYQSEVIMFPAVSTAFSNEVLTLNWAKKEIFKLGEDEEIDQLLQILNSSEIRDRIISKYHLLEHYKIDLNAAYPYDELGKEYNSNIEFAPTKFMSVRITVLDKDAQMAADIANDIASLVDTVWINMQHEKAVMVLDLVEKDYMLLNNQIHELEDSLVKIRALGVIDYESQAEVLTEMYGRALIAGNANAAKKLEQKLDILAKYGGAYVSIRDFLEYEKIKLSNLKTKYTEALLDANQKLPTKFIVNPAVKADKKSYPIRWLIVAVSTISAFILSVLLLITYDAIHNRTTILKNKK